MDSRVFWLDIVSLIVCWMCISGVYSTSDVTNGTRTTGEHIICNPKRRELSFPVVTDFARTTSTSAIFSQSSPPEVLLATVQWRRQRLDIVLHKNPVASPTSISEWTDGDITTVEVIDRSCTYQGQIKGQKSSYVALSTCNGLSGYIQTADEFLFIKPDTSTTTAGDDSNINNAHIIYTCEIPDAGLQIQDTMPTRSRRATKQTKYVEIQAVVDHTVVKTLGTKKRAADYVMTLMNIANTVYQHKTLGQNIQVAVVKIIFLTKSQQSQVMQLNNPQKTISLFCEWSVKTRTSQSYDVSMLITEDDFGHAGYAPVGVMCRQDQNCFAIRDEGFTSGFIIAHELGHVFGLGHDGEKNSCSGTKYKRSIMSAVVVSTFNHFWWSECSKKNLANLMRTYNCLDNRPEAVDNHYTLTASQELEENLGLAWSLDYQCSKDFGADYGFCKTVRDDPCKELVCGKKVKPDGCFTRYGIPLPGTNCGPNKKCFNKACVESKSESGIRVNGTWSEWSSWTSCTTGCGVGIKRRSRTCQFPEDVFRGYECEGDANVWSTCVDYSCKKPNDPRAEECSKWSKIEGVTKWLPSESQNASMKCQQACQAHPTGWLYAKKQNVADGTPCSYMQYTSDICVYGTCVKVGCDGELESSNQTDLCGICGGDNSLCKTITGVYTKTTRAVGRYSKVLRIPAGARHISVTKTSDGYSFLAVKDGRSYIYFLNGNKKYIQKTQVIHKGSMFAYTHGNASQQEIFHTPGPSTNPLDVMIYVVNSRPVSVSYNFTVSKDDATFEKSKFRWKFESWSGCSVTCNSGTKHTVYGCYDKDSNNKVDDKYCTVLTPPRIDKSTCRNPKCAVVVISYRWKATEQWTACDAACGETGIESRIYQCQKSEGSQVIADVEDSFCSSAQHDGETRECNGPECESIHWEVGSWSECSVTCGRGKEYRQAYCGDPDTDEDDHKCTDDPPITSKRCELDFCIDSSEVECSDRYTFCFLFSLLGERCQDEAFRQKCCRTCNRRS